MLLNREYIPLPVTTRKGKTYCGGHEVSKLIKDEGGTSPILHELLFACQAGDTKHQFIESILPLFEMADDDYYLGLDYIYTADQKTPAVLGSEEQNILGLYVRKDVLIRDAAMEAFEKKVSFYLMLLQAMDDDNVRIVDDVIQYVKRLYTLRSQSEKSFINDYLFVSFPIATPWRMVDNVSVPFNIRQFQTNNTESDDQLLFVHYFVSDLFNHPVEQITTIRNGTKTLVPDIILKFPDVCLLFEEDSNFSVFYLERKSNKALEKYRDTIEQHWRNNPVSTTEIEEE